MRDFMPLNVHCAVRFRFSASLAAACTVLFLSSCTEEPMSEESSQKPLVSRGIITASLSRHIEVGSDEPFESFNINGVFARYPSEESKTVDMLWDRHFVDLDLSLDSCTAPTPILENRFEQQGLEVERAIELLDVGDLSVGFDGDRKTMPTRTFPDLLKVAVGVIYSADETHGVVFKPNARYDVRATGSDDVELFRVDLDAPADLGVVRVDGTAPEEDLPLLLRGREVRLTWEGDGYGDEVVASVSWTSLGSPWEITCRMRDDGEFVIPRTVTAAMPDPLMTTDEEINIRRFRQVAFRSAGLSNGSFQFIVAVNFPVKF
jgi:hypothetical protein